jgi:hypothetical protein
LYIFLKSLQTMLLEPALLSVMVLLLLTTNAVHSSSAFKPVQEPSRSPSGTSSLPSGSAVSSQSIPSQQQPSFSSPITQPRGQQQPIIPGIIPPPGEEGQQQQPESIVPNIIQGEEQQQQQQQPEQAISQEPVRNGFKADGTVNSIISTPKVKWIATGNWSMFAGNGKIMSFITNMSWYSNNGTASHTHEFEKFVPIGGNVTLGSDNSVHLNGLIDVGTNHRTVWKNVHSVFDMKGGKAMFISVNDQETNNHFAGQPIYGVVTSLIRCSDEPGPDMEVLPPCTPS